ncbi:hypothetical protein F5Y12DRAFT_119367 [Xylaria sp. FL1777]|nr:hypothetical protein F5Y12DRAFT_119367 [Xylaria sp. FL1777]
MPMLGVYSLFYSTQTVPRYSYTPCGKVGILSVNYLRTTTSHREELSCSRLRALCDVSLRLLVSCSGPWNLEAAIRRKRPIKNTSHQPTRLHRHGGSQQDGKHCFKEKNSIACYSGQIYFHVLGFRCASWQKEGVASFDIPLLDDAVWLCFGLFLWLGWGNSSTVSGETIPRYLLFTFTAMRPNRYMFSCTPRHIGMDCGSTDSVSYNGVKHMFSVDTRVTADLSSPHRHTLCLCPSVNRAQPE